MEETGSLLPLFAKYCATQIQLNKHPRDIVNDFYKQQSAG